MDVARALHKINPAYSYRLIDSTANTGIVDIIEWLGPGDIPTQQQLEDAWILCLADDILTNQIQDVENSSFGAMSGVPGWATWDDAEALTWFTNNIQVYLDSLPPDITTMSLTTFDANRRAIVGAIQDSLNSIALSQKRQGQAIIAIRNKLWPNLQD